MIKVKVCGLTDPGNVKRVADSGIDYAGFIFFPGSKRFVGNNPDPELFRSVPEGIDKVGVFVNEDPGKVIELSEYAELKLVQLHGNENADYCLKIRNAGFRVIKVFRAGNNIDVKLAGAFSEVCDFFLFDTGNGFNGGSGIKFNWNILNGTILKKPFFLSGGVGPEDVPDILRIVNPMFFAVDINSRFEITYGVKDTEKVRHFVNQVKYSEK